MPPRAEPLSPVAASTLGALLTRAAERGGTVSVTYGATTIDLPAAQALSLDTSAAVVAERARCLATIGAEIARVIERPGVEAGHIVAAVAVAERRIREGA